jgi:hypothetical protein
MFLWSTIKLSIQTRWGYVLLCSCPFAAPSLPSACRAILLLFTSPGGLPGSLLILKASRRCWLCGNVGHVHELCGAYLPHSWHFLVPNFGPFAPRVADCFSDFVIFRPFGFARAGGSLLISPLLPWWTCINFKGGKSYLTSAPISTLLFTPN